MKIYKEVSLEEFEAWSGAVDTMETLRKLNRKTDEDVFHTLEAYIEDSTDDGCYETFVNDFLWFDTDVIADWLGYADWEELEKVANESDN